MTELFPKNKKKWWKYSWLGTSLVMISGIINLLNHNLTPNARFAWYILLLVATILTISFLYITIKDKK
jgi:hypothetical protein